MKRTGEKKTEIMNSTYISNTTSSITLVAEKWSLGVVSDCHCDGAQLNACKPMNKPVCQESNTEVRSEHATQWENENFLPFPTFFGMCVYSQENLTYIDRIAQGYRTHCAVHHSTQVYFSSASCRRNRPPSELIS